jgi:suppressor of ftsI/bilirubin oxidase
MSQRTYSTVDPKDLRNFTNPLRLPGDEGVMGVLDASDAPVKVVARWEEVEVLPGKKTALTIYEAESGGKTYTNPTFRVRRGSRFSAELLNGLDAETTIHWHGLGVLWEMDGHPLRSVSPGATYRYEFPVPDAGATYWYHPHAHGSTALQTYHGLSGLFLVEDEDEDRLREALGLELGETEVPLVIQDRTFDDGGNLVYEPDEMERFMGVTGDTVLVNLTPVPYLNVFRRVYRFRLLNGSNARTYRLAFADGAGELVPFWLVGTDGGLLQEPRGVEEVFLSPGERADALLDLGGFEAGDVLALKSLPFDPMHNEHEMDGGMDHADHHMGSARLGDGDEFYVLRLNVTGDARGTGTVPGVLSAPRPVSATGAPVRVITLSADAGEDEEAGAGRMRWLINGLTYELEEYPIEVDRGDVEVWEFRNAEESMPHPMHVHGFDMRVLDRAGSPEQVSRLAVDAEGRVATDLGRKDTVTVWPGETVRVAIDFSHDHDGEQLYLFHCHVLEHEDVGMMLNFKVVPEGS